jgi:uncharacterized Fe-S cluster-containing MiaB family protein
MTERAVLMREIKNLPDSRVAEVLDFVGCLKQKESGCPLCARYYEPNEETIAAFEEGDAMLRGEIPANHYSSVAEIWKEMDL